MKRKLATLILILAGWNLALNAQVVTADPVFPVASGSVVITFHADQGDMGLKDYTGTSKIYAHTGVITDQSTGGSDWKYVIADWGVFMPEARLTQTGTNTYTLNITPSIREYYGVPAGEKILKLAFVFRDTVPSPNTKTGRDVGGADIYYDVSEEAAFEVKLLQPDAYTFLADPGQEITLEASASVCDSLILYQNDTRLLKVTGATTISDVVTAAASGDFKLMVKGWHDNVMKADSAYYLIRTNVVTEAVPASLEPGVNITGDNSAAFLLYAPYKTSVYVMGDFNNWTYSSEGFMKRSPDGNWFWLEVSGLDPAEEYGFQYLIDESLRIPDPYATKILDPWNDKYIEESTYPDLKPYPEGFADGLVSVFQTRPPVYAWKNNDFTAPSADTLIIYELLVRDFVEAHDFKTITDSLAYLSRLGVNALEFMPVNEFDGNSSWGYNPSMYFAVDKYYGPADDFKELVDSCHSLGIAVIMDIVLNHANGNNPLVRMYFNSAENKPASNNPWFNVDAPAGSYTFGGYDFNHESSATKAFVDSVCHYWIDEFKIDGFRFDYTKGFTNTAGEGTTYDASRIAILERMGGKIISYKPDALLILEHWTDNAEEKELASYGFLLWGDGKYGYRNASMSKDSGISFAEASWKNLGWTVPGLVDYMESHDEERVMYLNMTDGSAVAGYNIKNFNIAIKRVKLTATFFLTIPGAKMLWQFQEVGYDYLLGEGYERVEEKPIRWDYYSEPVRRNLYDNFAALIELRKNNPAFTSDNYTLYETGKTKRLNIQHADMDVVVLGNFDVFPRTIDPNFTRTGTWYEFFSGKSLAVTAANQNTPISLLQGEYRLYTSKQVTRPSFLSGIDDQYAEDAGEEILFDIYPNPFSGQTVIRFTGENEYRPHTVEVFSATGATVHSEAVPGGIGEVTVDGTGLSPGIYYVKVTSGRRSAVRKMILL
jgi:1,4-alpha-glucan branching enzyme